MLTEEELKQNHDLTLQLFDVFKKICDENDIKYYVAEGTAIGTVREKGFIPWDTNMDINLIVDQYDKLDVVMSKNVPSEMVWDKPIDKGRMVKWLIHKQYENSFALKPVPNIDVSIFAPTSNFKVVRYIHLVILHYGYEAFKLKQTTIKRKFPYNVLKIVASIIPNSWYFAAQRHFLYKYNIEKSNYLINMAPGGHFHVGDIVKKEWFDGPEEVMGEFEGRTVRLPSDYDTYLRRYYGDYMTPKKANKGQNVHVK